MTPGHACRGLNERRIGVALVALCLALGAVTGCTSVRKIFGQESKSDQQAAQLTQLQLRNMRFADEYVGAVVEPVTRFQRDTQDPAARLAAQNWKVSQATSAYTIASGPNPVVNALDMVVLSTLSRMVMEDSWVQETYGERAIPVRDAYRRLESRAWIMVEEFLTDSQVEQLRQVIDDWRERNPNVRAVAYVHFRDFAKSIGYPRSGEGSGGSLFAFLGLDPLSTLDPAVREIAQTRQLAERTIYYAQRVPSLIDMQVERITYSLATMPETRALLADMDRVSKAAEAYAVVVNELPDVLAREREAAIRQFMGELQCSRTRCSALATELRKALEAGPATSDSLQGTLRSFDTVMARFDKPPDASQPPAQPSRPFDITEYGAAARDFAATAKELEMLIGQLEAGTPGIDQLAQRTTANLSDLIDRAFWRLVVLVIVLVGAILLAAIAYRAVAKRLSRA